MASLERSAPVGILRLWLALPPEWSVLLLFVPCLSWSVSLALVLLDLK